MTKYITKKKNHGPEVTLRVPEVTTISRIKTGKFVNSG